MDWYIAMIWLGLFNSISIALLYGTSAPEKVNHVDWTHFGLITLNTELYSAFVVGPLQRLVNNDC